MILRENMRALRGLKKNFDIGNMQKKIHFYIPSLYTGACLYFQSASNAPPSADAIISTF